MSNRELDPETEKMISDFLEGMANLMQKKTDRCIRCGNQVKALEKIGRCVYARPCGCRLWQGKVPDAWRTK